MARRVVLFVGYNSSSYELIRKLRLSKLNTSYVELIHIPDTDDLSLPSIVVENVVNGRLMREELRITNDLNYYLERINERFHDEDQTTEFKHEPLSVL